MKIILSSNASSVAEIDTKLFSNKPSPTIAELRSAYSLGEEIKISVKVGNEFQSVDDTYEILKASFGNISANTSIKTSKKIAIKLETDEDVNSIISRKSEEDFQDI